MQQPVEALRWWLAAALAAYNGRFKLALNRGYNGLGREAEGAWAGEYDFVQLADPQLGMLHMDKSWAEELTMLKLAIDHVNRLRPRFLLISGDLTNAWPCKENARVIAAQRASFQEALRELDPSIPLVLQPGNHDIGQNPSVGDATECRAGALLTMALLTMALLTRALLTTALLTMALPTMALPTTALLTSDGFYSAQRW